MVCILYQKSGKETILEEFEFKGIEEEEEEGDSLADMERNSAEGDKDKGEARPDVFIWSYIYMLSSIFYLHWS